MADRLPGARRDFVGAIQDTKRAVNATRRPTSTIRLGDWVLEARPTGLHATHPASGVSHLIAEAPETAEETT